MCCEVYKYAIKFASLDPADRLEAFRVVAGPPRRMLSRCMGEFYGLGIDSPDAKDQWRAEQALAQAGAGDCERFGFNSRSGFYELRSHGDIARQFLPAIPVCDVACAIGDIPF